MASDGATNASATPARGPGSGPRPTRREAWIWGALVVFMLALVGLLVLRVLRPAPEPPPVFGEVPAFTLTDHRGTRFGSADLAGAPFVADFVFTRCVAVCPRMTAQMKKVEATLPADSPTRIVSISVDPEHDTPPVLADYAARFETGSRWTFLTGEREPISALVRDGFMLALDRSDDPEVLPGDAILHSNRFVLVDGRGQIRGFYDSFDPEALARLYADEAALRSER